MSLQDLIQVFCGSPSRLDQLRQPLRDFVDSRMLTGREPTEQNINSSIESVIGDIDSHVVASSSDANVVPPINYVATLRNFIRIQMQQLINLIYNTGKSFEILQS